MTYDMNEVARTMNVLFVTLDSLRFDVANDLFLQGRLPQFEALCPQGWGRHHSPGSFTYAAHHAFFAGFLPTPADNPKAPRLFAARFSGSETTSDTTLVFDTPDIVTGFDNLGFRTVCIGGVGFFNQQTALGKVLPGFFKESYWEPSFGVTDPSSTANQFDKAASLIQDCKDQPYFMFINVAAIHQPNYFYLPGATSDSLESHGSALQYVDSQLPVLMEACRQSGRDTFSIFCSDHGTAYGEENYHGHRIGHSTVWDVPMATFVVKQT